MSLRDLNAKHIGNVKTFHLSSKGRFATTFTFTTNEGAHKFMQRYEVEFDCIKIGLDILVWENEK